MASTAEAKPAGESKNKHKSAHRVEHHFLRSFRTCEGCGTGTGEGKRLYACAQCKLAFYCSRECQKKHWKAGHKQHCATATARKEELKAGKDKFFQLAVDRFTKFRKYASQLLPLAVKLLLPHMVRKPPCSLSAEEMMKDMLLMDLSFNINTMEIWVDKIEVIPLKEMLAMTKGNPQWESLPDTWRAMIERNKGCAVVLVSCPIDLMGTPMAGVIPVAFNKHNYEQVTKVSNQEYAQTLEGVLKCINLYEMQAPIEVDPSYYTAEFQQLFKLQIVQLTRGLGVKWSEFLLNALHVPTPSQLHLTHIVCVYVQMGQVYGQIEKLVRYEVRSLEELKKQPNGERFNVIDLKNDPRLLASRLQYRGNAYFPVLFTFDKNRSTFLFIQPDLMDIGVIDPRSSNAKQCKRAAQRLFDNHIAKFRADFAKAKAMLHQ